MSEALERPIEKLRVGVGGGKEGRDPGTYLAIQGIGRLKTSAKSWSPC
jgi:hypothetical protein